MTENLYIIDLVRNTVNELEIATRSTIKSIVDVHIAANENDKLCGSTNVQDHLITLLETGQIKVVPRIPGKCSAWYEWVGDDND